MFLLSIKIFNFKCFSYHCLKENISCGINVFVGANGSGKTSFFDAVFNLFFEKEPHSKIFKDERFTNSGEGEKSYSIIECIFDNSDGFFPIPRKKVKIRRIFNMKWDKIFINDSLFSLKNFRNLFNSFKITSEQIYFKIDQGAHSSFKVFNPFKRLKIFKKYIGLEMFEKFKAKTIGLLNHSNSLKKKIENLICHLTKKTKKNIQKMKSEKKIKNLKKKIFFLKNIFEIDKNNEINAKGKFFKKKIQIKKNFLQINSIRIFFFWIDFQFFQTKRKSLGSEIKKKEYKLKNKKEFLIRRPQKFRIEKIYKKIETYFSFKKIQNLEKIWFNSFKKQENIFKKKINFGRRKKVKNDENFRKKVKKNENSTSIFTNLFTERIFGLIKNKNGNFFKKQFLKKSIKKIEKTQMKFLFPEKNPFLFKKKIYFYLSELSVEKEILKKNLFKKEKNLENNLGGKIVKGVRNLLYLLKKNPNLRKKVFGLFLDLFSVHKYFSLCVENLSRKILTFIVVENKESAIEIIEKSQQEKKIKMTFLINSKNRSLLEQNINIPASIPIRFCLYYEKSFNFLMEKLFFDTFVTKSSKIVDQLFTYKKFKFTTLDGEVYQNNGVISSLNFSPENSLLLTISFLKKERLFLEWINLIKKKLNKNLYQLHFFFLKKFSIIKWSRNIKKTCKNLYCLKKQTKKKKNSLFYLFDYNTKKEKKLIMKKVKKNFSKIVISLQNKKLFSSLKNKKKKIMIFSFSNMQIFWKNYLVFSKKFFFFFFQMKFKKKNKIFFNTNSNKKNFPEIFFSFFNPKGKNLSKNTKKNFILFSISFLKILREECVYSKSFFQSFKILFSEKNKKPNYRADKKFCFFLVNFFHESFVLISDFLKFKFPNVDYNKKEISFRNKIFDIIYVFREIETDLLILKQTFNDMEEKNERFFYVSLGKVSKKFNQLCEKILNGGRGSIIIHYNNCYDRFSKKKFLRKVNGLSILFKSEKEGVVNFCDQVSTGQASLVFALLLISFREIIKVKIYILDEFDSNFDPNFLKIFCYLIKQLSSLQIQFLISSYKKNFLSIGDKWFGVSFLSKGSIIGNIDKKNALKFVSKTFV
ncbi:smc3 (nucleomorph) [Hemiselmis andersenii]|uniref:Smc3 n=1 Tax=Hemiselmis andersenii TaxID=464988 RepID=A9BK90_HEMAN|nr:smc3 [Hemiselmis andersenii]ABW97923.1 smc3 [Hemiselmis andersenii]